MFGSSAQLTRIEHKLNAILRVLLRTEQEVLVAYEAELAAAEAAAKANTDAKNSAKVLFATLADIIATLKAGGTDPATAERITALTAALQANAEKLASAVVAGTPAA